MDEKKLQELMNDEEFVKQVMSLKTEGEVQEAFKAKGVEISVDEIKKLGEEGNTALEDSALENVSGGNIADVLGAYKTGIQTLPWNVGDKIAQSGEGDADNRYSAGEQAALYAGAATPWALGAAVCGGLIYGGIKTGAFKSAYGKAKGIYGAAKDKIGNWTSSKKVK